MSVAGTRAVMDRYFAAMGAGEDFSSSFAEDVTWLMVDSSHEVRGPAAVRAYLDDLHGRMLSGDQRELVVTDGHALLEGSSVNAGGDNGPGLVFCLVYDLDDSRITAMRCYGNLARLMPGDAS
jgi:hypothetical protein